MGVGCGLVRQMVDMAILDFKKSSGEFTELPTSSVLVQ